jgi:hypothetical protein
MRLPNINELESAYNSGKTKIWDGDFIWSSTPSEPDFYFVINLKSGSAQGMYKFAPANVKCVR